MMYMDDAIRATIELMEADSENLSITSSYNINGVSFNPEELYKEIRKHYYDFKIKYNPDFRQEIADSWPHSINDTRAHTDWRWKPYFDLSGMTKEILEQLQVKNPV